MSTADVYRAAPSLAEYRLLLHRVAVLETGGGGGTGEAPSYANMPAGSTFFIDQNPDLTWPDRPSQRLDLCFRWRGTLPAPPLVAAPAMGGMYEVDEFVRET